MREPAASLGVRIEAEYTVGEYDIVGAVGQESQGLETWLKQNDYNIPVGASEALAPYIRSDMKFFVAKVNLKEQGRSGFTSLRPLQFAFSRPVSCCQLLTMVRKIYSSISLPSNIA